MVRTKFRVESNMPSNGTDAGGGFTISLNPVVGGNAENEAFFKATPSGNIAFHTVNPAAAEQFKLHQEFYVDFTPVAPSEAGS